MESTQDEDQEDFGYEAASTSTLEGHWSVNNKGDDTTMAKPISGHTASSRMPSRKRVNVIYNKLRELKKKMHAGGGPGEVSPYYITDPDKIYKIAEYWITTKWQWTQDFLRQSSSASAFKKIYYKRIILGDSESAKLLWVMALSLGFFPRKGYTATEIEGGKGDTFSLPADIHFLSWTTDWFRYPYGISEPSKLFTRYVKTAIELAMVLNPLRKSLGAGWYPTPDYSAMVYWKAYHQACRYSLILGDLLFTPDMKDMPDNLKQRVKVGRYYHLGIGEYPKDVDPNYKQRQIEEKTMLETAVTASVQMESMSSSAAISAYEEAIEKTAVQLNEQNKELINAKDKIEELTKQLLDVGTALEDCRRNAAERADLETEAAIRAQQRNLGDVIGDAISASGSVSKAIEDNDKSVIDVSEVEEESDERRNESRDALLRQIERGIKLKKVSQTPLSSTPPAGALGEREGKEVVSALTHSAALLRALQERRQGISPEEEEETEEEWGKRFRTQQEEYELGSKLYLFYAPHHIIPWSPSSSKRRTQITDHPLKRPRNPFGITLNQTHLGDIEAKMDQWKTRVYKRW